MDEWERRVLSQYSTPGMRALAAKALRLSSTGTTATGADADVSVVAVVGGDGGGDGDGGCASDDALAADFAAGCAETSTPPRSLASSPRDPNERAHAVAIDADAAEADANAYTVCVARASEGQVADPSARRWPPTSLLGSVHGTRRAPPGNAQEAPMIFNQHTLSWEGGGDVDMSGFDEDEGGESARPAVHPGSTMPAPSHRMTTALPCSNHSGANAADPAAESFAVAGPFPRYELSGDDREFFTRCEQEHAKAMELFMSKRYYEKLRRHHVQAY